MKMLALFLTLLLAGCTTTQTRYVYVTYDVPNEYFECAQLKKSDFPADVSKLTDDQVATLLGKTVSKLRRCGLNATSSKEFIKAANELAQRKNAEVK